MRLLAGRRTSRFVVALVLGTRVRQIPAADTRSSFLRLPSLFTTLSPLSLRALPGLFASPSCFALLSVLTPQSFQAAFSVLAALGVVQLTGRLMPDRFFLAASVVGLG
ncbi:hypothetical protein EV651_101586 [Kribbella sp. VKM Ac-2571]|nr:hypothetical protein EV651_101586 [Kribbella sp. VKM Ac-2571]